MSNEKLLEIKTEKQGLMACLLILRLSETIHCLQRSAFRLLSRNTSKETLSLIKV